MTISKGVYAAGLSLLNEDLSLNLDLTVKHAENLKMDYQESFFLDLLE